MQIKAIIFDLDGTLIRSSDSVKYLCTLNDKLRECEQIETLENKNQISWIEADYLKAELIKELSLKHATNEFDKNVELIKNLEPVLRFLNGKRINSVLITAGPIQAANIVGQKYSFDEVYGSLYELKNDMFTGKILNHLGSKGKVNCLNEYCNANGILPNQCAAIGDSESDIDMFQICGKSIAINYSDALNGKATDYIITDDLFDIVKIIESWLA